MLQYLQIPFEVKLWDFGDAPGGVKGPEFLKVNENGRVPALEDPNTGVVSWESGAIINYLLRVYDKQNKLGPRGDSEQQHVDFDKWYARPSFVSLLLTERYGLANLHNLTGPCSC